MVDFSFSKKVFLNKKKMLQLLEFEISSGTAIIWNRKINSDSSIMDLQVDEKLSSRIIKSRTNK